MPANVETMAYSHRIGVPWHGQGFDVPDGASPEEMANCAKVNWRVRKAQIGIREFWKDINNRVPLKMNSKQMVAVVRETDGTVYQIATAGYEPVQNVEMLKIYSEFCEAGELSMETVGSLGNGNIIWGLAKVEHGADFSVKGVDPVKAYVMLANSHDGSMRFVGKFTDVCVVCNNTFDAAMSDGNKFLFSIKHTGDMKYRIEQSKQVLKQALSRQQRMYEVADMLASTKAEPELVESYVYQLTTGERLLDVIATEHRSAEPHAQDESGSLLDRIASTSASSFVPVSKVKDKDEQEMKRRGKSILDAIVNSPGSELESRDGTWWGAFNGVTYYTDHKAGRTRDSALRSAWYGTNNTLKANALELAVEYASAVQKGGGL